MKVIKRKAIIYFVIYGILATVFELIQWNPEASNDRLSLLTIVSGILIVCIFIFDIGRTIKNKEYRKRYILYLIAISLVLSILFLASSTIPADNDWFRLLGMNISLIPFIIIILDISKIIKTNHSADSFMLRIFAYVMAGGLIIITLVEINNLLAAIY